MTTLKKVTRQDTLILLLTLVVGVIIGGFIF